MNLKQVVSQFKQTLTTLIKDSEQVDLNASINIAVALYFVSYFHMQNHSCRQYLLKNGKDPEVLKFIKLWNSTESARLEKIKESTKKKFIKCPFDTFFNETLRVEE